MDKVTCYYYLTESGRSPAQDFIKELDPKSRTKFFFVKDLLEAYGHRLPEPYAKYIGNQIFELRFKGKEGAIRVLYFFFHHNQVIFTNGFVKKSNQTPMNEKEIAIQRRKKFLERQK